MTSEPSDAPGASPATDTVDMPSLQGTTASSDEIPSAVFERLEISSSQPAPAHDSNARESSERQVLYRADPDRVLRVLSANQFEDPFLAFREIYANALDACRGRVDAHIAISVSSDRVVVEDNGTGLDDAGLEALTTLGASTRRNGKAIGRFGIGFASVFDPSLGVARVDFTALRVGSNGGVCVRFTPDVAGGVSIRVDDAPVPRAGGSRVEIVYDPSRAPIDRAARAGSVFETHAAYSGVDTTLDGRSLGKDLADYVRSEVEAREGSAAERALIASTAVRGPVGVAAIDPARAESKFRAYQLGLFVCELPLERVRGRPWPRGVFGAVGTEGLELVASRNAFVENARFLEFQKELERLAREAAYRIVRHFESTGDAYARVVLLDALRRGLRTTTPASLLAESDDLFSSAIVRSPLFREWGSRKTHSFEELVALSSAGRFRALSYRPAWNERASEPILRADDSIERDIFRKLSGMRDMPAIARAEDIAQPSLLSRLRDRLMSGPRAEYSLFQKPVDLFAVPERMRRLVDAMHRFLATEEVTEALVRLLPGPQPRLGFGCSRNAFGPVAAYRIGEIRFNIAHRSIKRLAKLPNADVAVRALLPVLAHELAHMCHELHDLDFYRTSRAILRALVVAAAKVDARLSAGTNATSLAFGPEPSV